MAGAGAASYHRRRRAAFQLSECLGHVHSAGLEATGDQLQLLSNLVQPVEHIEKALARHREDVIDTLRDQSICKRTPSRPWDDVRFARLSQFHSSLPLCPSGRINTG
jgi:hypothetical protein